MYLPKLFPFDFFVALDGSWLLIWFGAEKKHPPEVLEMFIAANLCLGELEERLIVGDTVYGN